MSNKTNIGVWVTDSHTDSSYSHTINLYGDIFEIEATSTCLIHIRIKDEVGIVNLV